MTPDPGPDDAPAEAVPGEAATEGQVREEERQRDDAGRQAGHAGWGTQAVMFGGIGAFVILIGAVYWFMAYEWAGATFLFLTAGLALLTAAYLGWPRKGLGHGAGGAGQGEPAEPGHDPHDGVWFPEASVWPLAIGAGMALVANGLLLGRWLLVPASVFLLWAVAGMVRQGRHRT